MTSNITSNNNGMIDPYNAEWSLLYEKEMNKIKEVFGNFLIDIQHIVSTSIPEISKTN